MEGLGRGRTNIRSGKKSFLFQLCDQRGLFLGARPSIPAEEESLWKGFSEAAPI